MSESQFIHVETYGRRSGARSRNRTNTAGVFKEGRRDREACPHVAAPEPPKIIAGLSADDAERCHDAAAAEARTVTANGWVRSIRCDQHTLYTEIASHPFTWQETEDPEKADMVARWRDDTVAWWQTRFGDDLLSVIEHTDEKHPHLHLWVLPQSDPELRAKRLHRGHVAKERAKYAAKQEGYDEKAAETWGNRAYRQAMRELQNEYWEEVGKVNRLARIGPGRDRVTRKQYFAQKDRLRENAELDERIQAKRDECERLHRQAEEAFMIANETQKFQMQAIMARQAVNETVKAWNDVIAQKREEAEVAERERRQNWFQREEMKARIQRVEADYDKMVRKREAAQQRLEEKQKELESVEKRLKQASGLGAKLQAAGSELRGHSVEKQVEEARSEERERAENVKKEYEKVLSKLREQLKSERSQRHRVEAELAEVEQALDRSRKMNRQLDERLNEIDPQRDVGPEREVDPTEAASFLRTK